MDSLASLTTFVQVAESRSFSDVGRASGVSATAVGKSVARLEASLGVRLFHRSTRSVALTAEGQMFLIRARRILAEAESAREELSAQAGRPRGRLRVSLPVISGLLLPVLADFMHQYPEIQLDLDFSDRLVDVVDEGFDVVLRVGEPSDSRLSARRVGDFRRCLVASPAYLQMHGTPVVPADLAQHRCLQYRFPSTGRVEAWPLKGLPAGFEIPHSMVSNNTEARVCFAMRGEGIAYVPDHTVSKALGDGSLVTLLDDHLDAPGVFHLLWPSGRHMMPKLRVFIDFVDAQLMRQTPCANG